MHVGRCLAFPRPPRRQRTTDRTCVRWGADGGGTRALVERGVGPYGERSRSGSRIGSRTSPGRWSERTPRRLLGGRPQAPDPWRGRPPPRPPGAGAPGEAVPRMIANGSAAGTAHQAHRTIRTAIGEAVRRGHLTRNPAALAKPPRLPDAEVQPYSVPEVQAILRAAVSRRNSARWAVALALGLRQGEALGLKWSDVDLDNGALTVRRALLRPKWRHGAPEDAARSMPRPGERTPGRGRYQVARRPPLYRPAGRPYRPTQTAPERTGRRARNRRPALTQ